jgi:uncharacterized membrane protein
MEVASPMSHPDEPTTSDPRRNLLEIDRLNFLTDGVFAIALTLLVLDLKLPDDPSRALGRSLVEMIPRLAIYLFAFSTIANQWVIHHRTFRLVHYADGNLVLLSLLTLLFITLIPASAAIVGGHPTDRLAAACYAINSLLLSLSAAALWGYVAMNGHLLAEGADPRILRGIALVWLLVGLGFIVSLAVGIANVFLEYAVWVSWSQVVTYWWHRRRLKFAS